MPIRVTAVASNPALPHDGAQQAVLTPAVTTVYGVPAPEKLAAVRLSDGTAPTLEWTMRDLNGAAVDLTSLTVLDQGTATVPLRCRLQEAAGGDTVAEFAATARVPDQGQVVAVLDSARLGGPGIFYGELAVMLSNDPAERRVVFSNQFLVLIDASLFGAQSVTGPPSLAEIRLHLRDSSPAEQRLIDTVTFDNAEIAACIRRPVDYFNEINPPILQRFSTQDFPFRYYWLEGIKVSLFRLAAEYYRKNHLQYQAGGVAVDDLNKANDYEAIANAIWQEFTAWARSKKVALNLNEGWGVAESEYNYLSGYGNPFGSY
jgi:hypothetical protein